MIKDLKNTEYEQNPGVLTGISIIDFYRTDCGPCSAVAPELEKVAKIRTDINIFKVNVDEEPDLASKFRVMATPTILFYDGESLKKKIIGFKSAEGILTIVETIEGDKENKDA